MPTNETTDAQRHQDNQRRMAEMEQRLARLEARSGETLDALNVIKSLIAQLDVPSLRDMAETMVAMRGGVKVLGWLERPAKWVMAIAGAAGALYGLWKLK